MSCHRRSLVLLIALGTVLFAVSCGDGGSTGDATATRERPSNGTPVATQASTTPTGPNESGNAPVFYRTADDFASVVAAQPYKVLFRITNGYAELTLDVAAQCTSCPSSSANRTARLSGIMVQPVGEEAPGSYYPVNLLLPEAGHWELTVQAGADEVTIPLDVRPTS